MSGIPGGMGYSDEPDNRKQRRKMSKKERRKERKRQAEKDNKKMNKGVKQKWRRLNDGGVAFGDSFKIGRGGLIGFGAVGFVIAFLAIGFTLYPISQQDGGMCANPFCEWVDVLTGADEYGAKQTPRDQVPMEDRDFLPPPKDDSNGLDFFLPYAEARSLQEELELQRQYFESLANLPEEDEEIKDKRTFFSIRLSQTCEAMAQQGLDGRCLTYEDIVDYDNTIQQLVGEFTDEGGWLHRENSNYKDYWRWYWDKEGLVVAVDPPEQFWIRSDKRIMIEPYNLNMRFTETIASNSKDLSYFANNTRITTEENEDTGEIEEVEVLKSFLLPWENQPYREYKQYRSISDCHHATIISSLDILKDTFDYMVDNCPEEFDHKFEYVVRVDMPVSVPDLKASPVFQQKAYYAWIEAKGCNLIYNGCAEIPTFKEWYEDRQVDQVEMDCTFVDIHCIPNHSLNQAEGIWSQKGKYCADADIMCSINKFMKNIEFEVSENLEAIIDQRQMSVTAEREIFHITNDLKQREEHIVFTGVGRTHLQPIVLQVFAPNNNFIHAAQLYPIADGSFTYNLVTGGPMWKQDGTYKVLVSQGAGNKAEHEFLYDSNKVGL